MKMDQIAYYAHNESQVESIKASLGLQNKEWIEDEASGSVTVTQPDCTPSFKARSKGLLRFNYDLGIELEILTYLEGPHWHENRPEFIAGEPFLSHIGFHMEEGEGVPFYMDDSAYIAQVMDTDHHTNDYVNSKSRTYHYEIYDTVAQLGNYSKFIWRIEP